MPLKVSLTYVKVPILDQKSEKKKKKTYSKKATKFWGRGKKKGQVKRDKPTKKDSAAPKIVYTRWPVFNPYDVFESIIMADGGMNLLQSSTWSWSQFWQQAAGDDYCKGHPVLSWSVGQQSRAVAVSFHGDEGQTKKQKNILVLSWSSLGVHGASDKTKFPFTVS